jgi:hypothetical protein
MSPTQAPAGNSSNYLMPSALSALREVVTGATADTLVTVSPPASLLPFLPASSTLRAARSRCTILLACKCTSRTRHRTPPQPAPRRSTLRFRSPNSDAISEPDPVRPRRSGSMRPISTHRRLADLLYSDVAAAPRCAPQNTKRASPSTRPSVSSSVEKRLAFVIRTQQRICCGRNRARRLVVGISSYQYSRHYIIVSPTLLRFASARLLLSSTTARVRAATHGWHSQLCSLLFSQSLHY